MTRRSRRLALGLTLRQCAFALVTSRHVLGRIENCKQIDSHMAMLYDLFLGLVKPTDLVLLAVYMDRKKGST